MDFVFEDDEDQDEHAPYVPYSYDKDIIENESEIARLMEIYVKDMDSTEFDATDFY